MYVCYWWRIVTFLWATKNTSKSNSLTITGFVYNTLAPDRQKELCNNATPTKRRFVKDNKHLVKLFQSSVTLCANRRGSSTEQEREAHTHGHLQTERACLYVRVLSAVKKSCWLPEVLDQIQWFYRVRFQSRHRSRPWLPSANTSVLKFSYHWYGCRFTH